MPAILFFPKTQPGLTCGCVPALLDRTSAVHVPAIPTRTQGPAQDQQVQGSSDTGGTGMALPTLVHYAPGAVVRRPDYVATPTAPEYPRPQLPSTPRPTVPPSHGLEASWLNPMELLCSEPVREVLFGSRKPSTRATYLAKWKRFTLWCAQDCTPPLQAPIPFILECLLHLKQPGLAVSSIKVHLAAISAFHPGAAACSVFANPMVGHFFKGLEHLYQQIRQGMGP